MKVEILYSGVETIVLDKPAGMISQGPRNTTLPELWELLQIYWPQANIVHRIDCFTSGIVLAGNSSKARAYFQRNWHSITKKIYLAIIWEPDWSYKAVDKLLDGKSASTSFQVLERSGGYALIRCELVQNGRTHQIRRHLRSIGCSIVGDRKYNGPKTQVRDGQLLHAWQVHVRLPDKDFKPLEFWVSFQSPIPADFKEFSFDWRRWDKGANIMPSGIMTVPEDWVRNRR